MAWDTEGTKQKLLEAGVRQFAAHGFAGARMDAIGKEAGVNKERAYQYFGGKSGLYGAVLADQLERLLDGVEVDGAGPDAVGRYAGELFDRFRVDPAPARLLAWESLELDDPIAADGRAELCRQRAGALQKALPALNAAEAAHLLLSVVTLAAGWWTLAHLARVIVGGDVSDAARREALVRQVASLAAS